MDNVATNGSSDIPPALTANEWANIRREWLERLRVSSPPQAEFSANSVMRVLIEHTEDTIVRVMQSNRHKAVPALSLAGSAEEIGRHHAVIALLNDALHDEDPRKLTREHVSALRAAAEIVERQIPPMPVVGEQTQDVFDRVAREAELYSQLCELADVLESYLPPSEA